MHALPVEAASSTQAFIMRLRPAGEASRSKLGAFLVMSQFQGSVNSSAMFLTAAAQNLLCMKLATELGVVIPSPWLTWFKVAVLPAALGLLITPFLLYKVCYTLRNMMYQCCLRACYSRPSCVHKAPIGPTSHQLCILADI